MTQAYPGASATRMSQDFPVLLKTENLEKVTQVPVSFLLLLLQKYTGGGGRGTARAHARVFRVPCASGSPEAPGADGGEPS